MFEVIWTDHNRELVGERKARKGLEKPDKIQDEDPQTGDDSGFTSISTGSISSSGDKSGSDGKSPGFLGSIRLKKSLLFSRNKSAATPEFQIIRSGRMTSPPSPPTPSTVATSFFSVSSDETPPKSPPAFGGHHLIEYFKSPWRNSPAGVPRDLRLSNSVEPTTPIAKSLVGSSIAESPCSRTEVVQALGPESWVAKTTETTFEPKSAMHHGRACSEVSIVVDRPDSHTPTPPASPERNIPMNHGGRTGGINPTTPSGFRTPQPPATPPSPRRSKDGIIPPPRRPAKFRAHNPDAWKPPADWGCRPSGEATPPRAGSRVQGRQDEIGMSMDLNSIQREVRRMACASPEVILVRLKEEWGQAQDPAFYRELEMEQKRWMLSALYNLDKPRNGACVAQGSRVGPEGQKILALFESQATASYLAAVHHDSLITHLSPSPLSHQLFPNVQPLSSPLLSNSALSVASSSFTAVHCLPLPSTVPSQGIPALLHNINRCLVPGGALHLTLIDPSPAAGSLGPRMRHWLEKNLLLSVERQFRCMNPTKLFPIWLADAGLRAEASTIAGFRFHAASSGPEPGDGPSMGSSAGDEERVRLELRSTVGRTLWREVWGAFVNGDSWWWEEGDIVDECLRLGTYWEYSIIEAVKEA